MRHVLVIDEIDYELDTLTVAELTEISKATGRPFGHVDPLNVLQLAAVVAVFKAREIGDDAAIDFITARVFGVEDIECRYTVSEMSADEWAASHPEPQAATDEGEKANTQAA